GPAHVHRRGPVLRDGDLRALDKPVHGLQNCRSSHAAPPEAPKRASGWPVPAAPRRACGGGHSTGPTTPDNRPPPVAPRSSGSGDVGLWGQPAVHPPAVAGFTAWAATGAASTVLSVEDCLRQPS
ncbi:unnamed protein product, partial [Ixodes pacificus]